MQILRRIDPFRRLIRRVKRRGKTIGLVPTLGALHEGHLSLIRAARRESGFVVVSVFVNPIQFNQRSDFQAYPRPLARDARLAAAAGADLLFAPSVREIYPAGFQTFVEVTKLTRDGEGYFRPGHFRGVTTVVAKLFHLAAPDRAYFGQKDAQQARVVRQMIRDLNFDLRLRVLPTVREADGLAMSSRNRRLSPSARRAAASLFEALQEGRQLIKSNLRRTELLLRRMRQVARRAPGLRIEYLTAVDPETFRPVRTVRGPVLLLGAARVGGVRLIDCLPC